MTKPGSFKLPLKKPTEEHKEEIQEATVSLAAAEDTDASEVAVLSNMDVLLTLK